MNIEEIRVYCLNKTHSSESLPFDDQTLVFKVGGKMFAVLSLDEPMMALKARPEEILLRMEHFAEVKPARYFDKRHWHAVQLDALTNSDVLRDWIDHSYTLIVEGLTKKLRIELGL